MKKYYKNVSQIGNRIYHRWVDDKGKERHTFGHCTPTLFVPVGKDTGWKGIHGENLQPFRFDSIKDAKEFIKEHEGIGNLKIHGNQNWWAQFIQQEYPNEIQWDLSQLRVVNFDIEVLMGTNGFPEPEIAPNMITAIAVECGGHYMVFGSKEYTGKLPKNAKHIYCKNEEELLYKFLDYWQELCPDIVTGWNIEGFDIPYIINRIERILGEEYTYKLSPAYHDAGKMSISRRESEYGVDYTIHGTSVMDMLKSYKKFTYQQQEKYSLDHIAYVELKERKLDYSEYGNLDDLYEKDYNTYIDYNIRDAELVKRINDKLNLMMLMMTLSYMCRIPQKDVYSQVRMWDTLIYNYLLQRHVVVPPKSFHSKDEKYEGAVVFPPKTGLHDWVVSFDLNSLYPHLIMQYNISPEVLENAIEYEIPDFKVEDLINGTADTSILKQHDLAMTANSQVFRKDQHGFLAEIMENLYGQRKAVKQRQLEAESDVEKIKDILEKRKKAA